MIKLILGNFEQGIIMNLGLLIISILIYIFLPLEKIYKEYEEKLGNVYYIVASVIAYLIFSKFIWDTYRANNTVFYYAYRLCSNKPDFFIL